ncbi:MAG: ADP-glyceromanno-heptose 6-epimerase [Gammaproteobacteria bacterium]|nr:ADP-glyceromanno-heptose 6-epimerase [Gammaproteobacteria bacterium]
MILVTGGAGFIGSNLAAALAERGAAVAVCDFLPGPDKARNLARLPLRAYIAPQELSGWLAAQAAQVQAVVHLGAITATTETNAELITAVNVRLSQQLWQWCAAAGTRFIYASSAATYGSGSHGFDDDGSPAALARLEPLNLYGSSKHAFDLWVAGELAAGAPHPPQWAGLKFFNVYGPNEYHKGVMRSVVALKYPLAAAGQPLTLFRSHRAGVPDGGQKRDFIYVRDCVAVMLWLLEHPRVSGLFNLGTGQARSFAELAAALCTALERTPRIEYVDTPPELRTHYQYFTEARMERLRSAGYAAPFTSLEDGVRDYVRRYLAQPDPYR